MVDRLNFLIQLKLDTYFPTQSVRTSNLDGKISSVAVKQACRRKNREYLKHGNGQRFKELRKVVKIQLKNACSKLLSKQVEWSNTRNSSWMKHVKRVTAQGCPIWGGGWGEHPHQGGVPSHEGLYPPPSQNF